MDGHRAIWDGRRFVSRGGNIISCPAWFTAGLPAEVLDGELWAGRRRDSLDLVAAATQGSRDRDWDNIIYMVFDAPFAKGVFEDRIKWIRSALASATHALPVPFWKCKSKKQLLEKLEEVVAAKGEGLMLRKPGSKYERWRSDTLLKVKKKHSAEATVISHVEGTRPGLCGALMVINKEGKVFKVGSGITEAMAVHPPPIGTIITYEYELLTKDGIPRTAVFLRTRIDI